ncbi:nuclear transport factor 2 family protein [Streptomyces sp. NPDC050636]|uniref:nuclear transport factor 2 family protein n=1 Tax=Streptomyces sp. NPDC050636 TaxID=3154510 RepID=UPI003449A0AF
MTSTAFAASPGNPAPAKALARARELLAPPSKTGAAHGADQRRSGRGKSRQHCSNSARIAVQMLETVDFGSAASRPKASARACATSRVVPAAAETGDKGITMERDAAEHALRSYFAAIGDSDIQAVIAHLEPDAVLSDPYGTTRHAGTENIQRFIASRHDQIASIAVALTWHVTCGNRAVAHWNARAAGRDGRRAFFRGTTVFTFGTGTLFRSVEHYYNPQEFIGHIVTS